MARPGTITEGQGQDIVPALKEAGKVIWEEIVCLGFMAHISEAIADILGKDQKGWILSNSTASHKISG